jgi:mycobactin phenyloxazoline synthetase
MTAPFAPWVKHFPGNPTAGEAAVTVLFPHAGGAAAAYRSLAKALCNKGSDTYIVQYPRRADRLAHPAAGSVDELVAQLFAAGDWGQVAPLQLFGHCMGATVAFEFARVAERRGIKVTRLWASAGQAPCTVSGTPPLPTSADDMLADMVDLGGTDPRLLDDEDFVELLVMAIDADYRAMDTYACAPDVRVAAGIHVLGGWRDHRVGPDQLRAWATHTSTDFALTEFDGGHFYLNEHLDAIARLMVADVR